MSEPVTLDDDHGFIAKSSGFDDSFGSDIDPDSSDYEIGVANGEGYVKFVPNPYGEVVRFTVPKEEVEQYVAVQSKRHPAPRCPDGFEDPLPAPDGWEGGTTQHTGGNIWCRIWRKPHPHGYLEVCYGVPDLTGVALEACAPDGTHLGTIDHVELAHVTDDDAAAVAGDLMERVDDGEYDADITDALADA